MVLVVFVLGSFKSRTDSLKVPDIFNIWGLFSKDLMTLCKCNVHKI